MPVKYPYTQNVGTLRDLLKQIPTRGVPEKLSQEKLASYGYTSSNDRPIIGVLKFIGFLDHSGVPTEKYKEFRSKGAFVMASCLKSAYAELFDTYADAQRNDVEALTNFFRANTEAGGGVLTSTVNTFRTLCEFANFEAAGPVWDTKEGVERAPEKKETTVMQTSTPEAGGLVVNLNIQLQLPATEDTTIYDKIFQSLKKHLLER